ncbi:MAG: ParB/RepB/Spo0J family partition protein [bacterium]
MPSGLGRGLGSLIPQKNESVVNQGATVASRSANSSQPAGGILQIDINNITANSQQPRTDFEQQALAELAASIKEHGILQPLVVTKTDSGYQLIAGERRLRAAKIAGFKTVPATLKDADEDHQLVLALVENIQRENLNPIEEAKAYRQLLEEHGINQEKLSLLLSKPRPTITNTIRLLNLPDKVQQALAAGQIGKEQAKIIAGLPTEKQQLALLQNILDNRLSKRDTIIASRKMGGTKDARIKHVASDTEHQKILQKALGCPVRIDRRDRDIGRITIDFYSQDELDSLVKKLQ